MRFARNDSTTTNSVRLVRGVTTAVVMAIVGATSIATAPAVLARTPPAPIPVRNTPAPSPARRAPSPGGRMHPAASLLTQPQSTSLASAGVFACQSPSAQYQCYGPSQIRAAYDIQPLINAGKDGSGRTITIIDAFQDPTLASDLAGFDTSFGLAAPKSFRTIAPFGLTPFDATNPDEVGWSGEIALDVEWAHADAPGAAIVLALAPSDNDPDLVNTERYVINHDIGDVISMSYGEAESCMDSQLHQQEHDLFNTATAQGMTLLAGSGDEGAAQYTCDGSSLMKAVSTPASDPNVTAVGGTDLKANLSTGEYHSESVWNEPAYGGASGGGFSSLYARPSYQDGVVDDPMRGLPDVALTASNARGVVVGWGSSGSPGEYWIFAGTSVGTPQWAGIVAIADQSAGRDLGNINPALYHLEQDQWWSADFHDITVGNNDFPPIKGYKAGPGWDAATGLGSPDASLLVPALAWWARGPGQD